MKCPYCKTSINDEAIICKTCNSYVKGGKVKKQYNWFKRNSYWINWLSILLTAGFLFYGIKTYNASRIESENASEAVQKSNEALKNASHALENANKAKESSEELYKQSQSLLTNIRGLQNNTEKSKIQLQKFQAQLLSKSDFFDFVYVRTNEGYMFNPNDYMRFADAIHDQGLYRIHQIYDYNYHGKWGIDSSNVNKYFFDILEFAFFSWLGDKYAHNWIRNFGDKNSSFSPFSQSHLGGGWPQPIANNFTLWSKEEIIKELNENVCSGKRDYLIRSIYLPPNTKYSTEKTTKKYSDPFHKYIRKIKLENENFTFNIELLNGDNIDLDSLDLKLLKLDYLDPKANWIMHSIRISFESEFKMNNSFSEQSVLEYNWIENMKNVFRNEYDWNLIYDEIKSFRIK